MKTSHLIFNSIFFVFFVTALSFAQQSSSSGMEKNGVQWSQKSTVATVMYVMPDSGIISLQGQNGEILTLRTNKNVNLRNLKAGDKVNIRYYEAQALQILKPTKQDKENPFVVEQSVQPPKGTNPQGGMLRQIRALIKVLNVDKTNQAVTIEGPHGNTYTLHITDPSILEKVKTGSEYTVVFTEGIAASINKIK